MTAGDSRLPRRIREVRDCAQEIISARILSIDDATCEALIDEYANEYGIELAMVIYGFVRWHYVEGLTGEAVVSGSWPFLWALGELIEGVADRSGCAVEEVLHPILAGELQALPEATADELEMHAQVRMAIRAAQATLAAHFLVRRGHPPIGIQRQIEVDSLHLVSRTLGLLGEVVVLGAVDHGVSCPDLVEVLLVPVGRILRELAAANQLSVEAVLSGYWTELAGQDSLAQ